MCPITEQLIEEAVEVIFSRGVENEHEKACNKSNQREKSQTNEIKRPGID